MTDPRLEIEAMPRALPPGWDLDTPLFTLAWQVTQRWSEEIKQFRQNWLRARHHEDQAWITLGDECFRLQKLHDTLAPAIEQSSLASVAQDLALSIRRLQQALQAHDVDLVVPEGSIYAPELAEVMENVEHVPRAGIEEAVIQEVLAPIIKRKGQVIRFGKAIIAVPVQN